MGGISFSDNSSNVNNLFDFDIFKLKIISYPNSTDEEIFKAGA